MFYLTTLFLSLSLLTLANSSQLPKLRQCSYCGLLSYNLEASENRDDNTRYFHWFTNQMYMPLQDTCEYTEVSRHRLSPNEIERATVYMNKIRLKQAVQMNLFKDISPDLSKEHAWERYLLKMTKKDRIRLHFEDAVNKTRRDLSLASETVENWEKCLPEISKLIDGKYVIDRKHLVDVRELLASCGIPAYLFAFSYNWIYDEPTVAVKYLEELRRFIREYIGYIRSERKALESQLSSLTNFLDNFPTEPRILDKSGKTLIRFATIFPEYPLPDFNEEPDKMPRKELFRLTKHELWNLEDIYTMYQSGELEEILTMASKNGNTKLFKRIEVSVHYMNTLLHTEKTKAMVELVERFKGKDFYECSECSDREGSWWKWWEH